MAETTGFEPVEAFNGFNGLANRRFQPLSHVSAFRKTQNIFYRLRQLCQVSCIILPKVSVWWLDTIDYKKENTKLVWKVSFGQIEII
jgi:hypothetical protein